MKLSTIFLSLAIASSVNSKNVVDLKHELTKRDGKNVVDLKQFKDSHKRELEQPLFEIPNPLPSSDKFYVPKGEEPQKGPTLLTSALYINKDVSLYASYVRDDVDISERFNNRDTQTIVFAPTDSSIETLSLKPWQFPTTVDETKSDAEIEQTISSNVKDFVLSHVVDGEVPFAALGGDKKGIQLISQNGKNIKLVNDEGNYYVTAVVNGQDQEWLKVNVVLNADNGAILVISKPLSVPSI
ncbi:hypothetical protein WICMUC_005180 [Wickerhamomyces mucosus]|uniref:FAS1 domain-containing protein n=1 Tax=Wickerhamomyces mucosus TaxID=1378264 RepID=A0A9P8PAQ9_9ASCO|nr:hypothetical protein WICMUC_005180 [Wickerhamomyces mucosus]